VAAVSASPPAPRDKVVFPAETIDRVLARLRKYVRHG